MKRVFENPLIKDKVTILNTSRETRGQYLLLEVELQAGGGNSMHYHTSFDEVFLPVEGTLGVDLGKEKLLLQPGEQAIAKMNQLHRFYNPGKTPIRFYVKITPAKDEFIQGLSIAYGLAGDGKTNKNGIPKRFDHLAVIIQLTDTLLPGIISFLNPLIAIRARRARKNGVEKMLLEKYWQARQ